MHRCLIFIAALGAVLGLATRNAFAIKLFPQVEDGYPEARGRFELENTFTLDSHTPADTRDEPDFRFTLVVGYYF